MVQSKVKWIMKDLKDKYRLRFPAYRVISFNHEIYSIGLVCFYYKGYISKRKKL